MGDPPVFVLSRHITPLGAGLPRLLRLPSSGGRPLHAVPGGLSGVRTAQGPEPIGRKGVGTGPADPERAAAPHEAKRPRHQVHVRLVPACRSRHTAPDGQSVRR